MKRVFKIATKVDQIKPSMNRARCDSSRRRKASSFGKGVRFRNKSEFHHSSFGKCHEIARSPHHANIYTDSQFNNNSKSPGQTVDFIDDDAELLESFEDGPTIQPSKTSCVSGASPSASSFRKGCSNIEHSIAKDAEPFAHSKNVHGNNERLERDRVPLPDLLKTRRNRAYITLALLVANLVGIFLYTDFCPSLEDL